MEKQQSEIELAIEGARVGNPASISKLYQLLNTKLVSYLKRHVGDFAVQDVAQETWISVARGIKNFNGNEDEFLAWFFILAKRRVIDIYRKGARLPKTTTISTDLLSSDVPLEEMVVGNINLNEAIQTLTDSLPEDQAEVIMLRVVADLSVKQVAQVMNRSQSAIRTMQHRAILKLAESWEKKVVTNS